MLNQNSSKTLEMATDSGREALLELSGTLLTTPAPEYANFVRRSNNGSELVNEGLLPDLRITQS